MSVRLVLSIIVLGLTGTAWCLDDSRLPSQETMMHWVRELCRTEHRRPGTPEGHRAERFVADEFHRLGLQDVRVEPVPIEVWKPHSWSLTVAVGCREHEVPCFYLPYAAFTPPQGIERRLVYLGEGRPEDISAADLAGEIAVLDMRFQRMPYEALTSKAHHVEDPNGTIAPGDWQWAAWWRPNWSAYGLAHEAGAAAVVWILADQDTNVNTHYGPYDGVMKPLPGLYVGKYDGVKLRELCAAGASARFVLDGRCEPGSMANIIGRLPGPGEKSIAITSHHDSPFRGATEDGTGMASLLALARYYAPLPEDQRPAPLIFVATAGHFYGGAGMDAFVMDQSADELRQIALGVTVEHVGAREFVERNREWAPTGRLQARGLFVWPQVAEAAVAAVKAERLERAIVTPADAFDLPPPGEASGFHVAGIPCVQYITGPTYLLVSDDTLDKVEPSALLPVVRTMIRLIDAAAQQDWPDRG
ncbi:MAG: M28 family peptidase [Armatimonadota bacterium]|nr:MAG: M28 family peptidase [Armatimonadota bacterium]